MRQLIEARLRRGDTPDTIRSLLQLPNIEDHPPMPMHNQNPFRAISPPSNQNILQHEAAITLYADNPIDETWDTTISSMQNFTNPITAYTPTPSNNSTTLPGQFAFPYVSSNVVPNTTTSYSSDAPGAVSSFPSNENWSPSLDVFQPFDGNVLSQYQPFVVSSNVFDPNINPSDSQSK